MNPSSMQVVEMAAFGGSDVLRLAHRPIPQFADGEVLIRVSASGLNRPDILQRKGYYAPPAGASDILGLEVAGVIASGDPVAMQATGLSVGSRVCALLSGGGYAQWCVAPAAQCLPIPDGWTDTEAASIPEVAFTVWSNLVDNAGLRAGETVLIHGGSSGIGVMAIQLAVALGATVIVTAGSRQKCQACIDLGAHHAIDYKSDDFVARVLQITGGRGVDVVLDMVAGPYVEREIECMAYQGRLVIIAVQGGVKSQMNAASVMLKRLNITGSTLRSQSIDFKSAIARALRETLWPLLAARKIKTVIFATFSAENISQAHDLMESHQHVGKIVLTW